MSGFTFSGGGGGGGGGAVDSVFGRTGVVVAATGDYSAFRITNVPAGTIASTDVQAAINELDGDRVALAATVAGLVTGVSSVFGRSGAVVQVAGDYTGSQVTNVPAGNIAAITVQAALDELDGDKGGLTLANTWTQDNTFNGFVSAATYRVGATEIVDANRIFRPRSYTIGTLPAVTATGIIHCSDLGGGPGLLQSDGTGWNRVKEEGTATIATDAGHSFTWTRLVNAPVTRGNATLTALRTATLSATGARNGDRASFVRLGGGAFNWRIAGATNFDLTAADQYCTFEYDGAAWNIIDAGQISVSSGGGGVDVEDEGSLVLAAATTLNFVGAGVTATNAGGGQVDITIPGGGGGGGFTIGQYIGLRNATNF